MNEQTVFKINGKNFYARTELERMDSFEIKSIPRPYTVTWNKLEKPYELINKLVLENSNNLLLIDGKIYNMFRKHLNIPKDKIFTAKATEKFKTLDGVLRVIDFLQKNKITKGEKLVVVGGGIIQDVGAFVGACYKRGIPWVYVPTTLLSMCDSCIGGKTGINHNNAKNQLALFSAPSQIIINPNFLKTLDYRAINSGLGEILKLHITGGRQFLASYREYVNDGRVADFNSYKHLILQSLSVKKSIVEEDEFELNLRRSLNYGHTIGHAVEVLTNYKITHGEAVVIGVIIANELSNRKMMLSDGEKKQLDILLFELLDTKVMQEMSNLSLEGIGDLLKKDKKTLGDVTNFVVLKSIGDMRFFPLKLDSLLLNDISDIIKRCFQN